jgi:hypothetical protein
VSDKYKSVMHMTRYAQSKEQVYCLGSTGQTGAPDRSDRSGPASTPNWAAPVRPMPLTGQTGQVQSEHKATRVCAIWSKVIRPGFQDGLDHFAPFSQHKQYTIQFMHHNLAIELLKYYNKVQTHSSTHTMLSSPLR